MSAIIYTRFSPRPNADECHSCEKQEERCRAYCEKHGLYMAGIYSDKGVSGGVLDRPALSEAIASLRPSDVFVVDSSDRLARDMLVALTIRFQVEKAGATIAFADGSPTATTPEGELFTNILAAFAQYERSRIRMRTKRGLAKKKACGVYLGKPPIGWMRDRNNKSQLTECPSEQSAIRYIKSMGETGMSSEEITQWLNAHPISLGRRSGKPWSARTVRKILARS